MHRASAMAMEKRHGRYSGQTHKDRRQPRGGNRNSFREFLEDAVEAEEIRHEVETSPIE